MFVATLCVGAQRGYILGIDRQPTLAAEANKEKHLEPHQSRLGRSLDFLCHRYDGQRAGNRAATEKAQHPCHHGR